MSQEITPEKKAASGAAVKGCLGCAGLIFVGFLFLIVIGVSSGPKTPVERMAADQSADAYIACKNHVRDTLRSPSTADFPLLDFTAWKLGDGKYKIVSHVDAQNGFGAMIRMRYGCFAETGDGEQFTVTKLEKY